MFWDFGLLNSIKERFQEMGINIKILPLPLPCDYEIDEPYLAADVKNTMTALDKRARADVILSLENKEDDTSHLNVTIIKALGAISRETLRLFQGEEQVGAATVKIGSIENRNNKFMVTLNSLIWLRSLYHDA